ncbi:MAG: dihydrodipicolinate synthase family protein, partial [Gemmatimonadaceae bacterium]
MLAGAGTAIATPFTSAGLVDEAALRRFVAWQVEQGIDYIVPCGSTGEA